MKGIAKQLNDLQRWTRGMDRLMNPVFLAERPAPTVWRPPTDVYETDDRVVVRMEIAGMKPDGFEISFADRMLEIHGYRPDSQNKRSCHCLEIPFGEFISQVYLPGFYAEEEIDANYENGFLTITLPKLPPEQPHSIVVHTADNH